MSFKNTAISFDIKQQGSLSPQFDYASNYNRARNPITRSRGLVRGQFPSKKMSRMIAWESQLERRACYLFEFSSAIKSFREQPIALTFKIGDKIKKYTPDFELLSNNNELCYVEIKPLTKLSLSENQRRYHAIAAQLKKDNHKFIILTEKELINPTLENNLLTLRAYLNVIIEKNIIFEAKTKVILEQNLTLGQLQQELDISTSLGLIAQGFISIDFHEPISPSSIIMEANHENRLFSYRYYNDFR